MTQNNDDAINKYKAENRATNQIAYYSSKSAKQKKAYYSTNVALLVFSVTIPFLAGLIKLGDDVLKLALGVIGVVVGILSGLNQLFKFQEKWLTYRTTAENLKHELALYYNEAAHYDLENIEKDKILAEGIELMISTENTDWSKFSNIKK